MSPKQLHRIITYFIATVWLINGLFCKVLNWVPRHEQIVGRILGESYARPLTLLIGLAELVMMAWVLSGFQKKLNAQLQIFVVILMNILEFTLVPDLLLWGRLNSLFALCFAALVYYNTFILGQKNTAL